MVLAGCYKGTLEVFVGYWRSTQVYHRGTRVLDGVLEGVLGGVWGCQGVLGVLAGSLGVPREWGYLRRTPEYSVEMSRDTSVRNRHSTGTPQVVGGAEPLGGSGGVSAGFLRGTQWVLMEYSGIVQERSRGTQRYVGVTTGCPFQGVRGRAGGVNII